MTADRWWLPGVALVALLAVGLLVGVIFGRGGDTAEAFTLDGLQPAVVHNYEFAAAHHDQMVRVPCYCGCVALDHSNLFDCFLKPDGGWESHASGCAVCGDETTKVEAALARGEPIESARAAIDDEFGHFGRPTNTP